MSELDASKVLPDLVTKVSLFTGEDQEENQAICVVQLTFIKGGWILGLAVHHSRTNGPGANGFLTAWAESAVAASTGKPFCPVDPANLDRSRLGAATKPDAEQWKQLDEKFSMWKDSKGHMPPPPADFKMPTLASRMWHFPASKLK